MAPKAEQRADEPFDLEANDGELDPQDLARLRAKIVEADAAYARGEGVPFDVVLEDLDKMAGA